MHRAGKKLRYKLVTGTYDAVFFLAVKWNFPLMVLHSIFYVESGV